ncbi:hypothetical protein ACLK1X_05855 [Escherichia coli]
MPELPALLFGAANESDEAPTPAEEPHQPFLDFAEQILPQSVSRAAITAAYRRRKPKRFMLLEQARLPQPVAEQAHKLAYQLADKLRNQKNASGRAGMVQGLLQEFSLSSQEGVALMCLAEALLRIPDKATRDALVATKSATVTGNHTLVVARLCLLMPPPGGCCLLAKRVSTHNEASLSRSLNRIIGKSGEPLIRKGVDIGDAPDGRAVRHWRNHRGSVSQCPQAGRERFPLLLRYAWRSCTDCRRCTSVYGFLSQAIHAIGKASNWSWHL